MKRHDVVVEHVNEDRFRARVRGHEVLMDQPVEAGGDDQGPTPTEMFVVSLVGCVAFFAERFLRRHGILVRGLRAESSFRFAGHPSRVGDVEIRLHVPAALTVELRDRLLRVVEGCTVHNSIERAPAIHIALETEATAHLSPALGGG